MIKVSPYLELVRSLSVVATAPGSGEWLSYEFSNYLRSFNSRRSISGSSREVLMIDPVVK